MMKRLNAMMGCCMVAAGVCGQTVRDGPAVNDGRAVRSVQAAPAPTISAEVSQANIQANIEARRIEQEADRASRRAFKAALSNLLHAAGANIGKPIVRATPAERHAAAQALNQMADERRRKR